MIFLRNLSIATLLWPSPVLAQPMLTFPVDCTMGQTCFIEDYVDHDPRPNQQRDFTCGINSRDGHKGTDIALLSFDALGTPVRAAAAGQVLRTRDGMVDDRTMAGVTPQNACGNAVVVDHGDGWQTVYCHLAEGSIAVAVGDRVQTGDQLGGVGLSGQTNHPHLHLGLLHNGRVVDPFAPDSAACGETGDSLWATPLPYTDTGLITAGFSDRLPDLEAVTSGSARVAVSPTSAPLVIYAHAAHAQHGDLLTLEAHGPEGEVFHRTIILKTPQVSTMRAAGRRAPDAGWPPGDYLGEATLTRKGQVIAHRFAHTTVQDRP
ncbi:M23 family metallopeptidase [Sagittula sp. SSi028]|uniref:M23 family metallopeptidase n=1 Tax=Sagittula sp. SSi028 TaxID=3400636 RepID=UPI003AF5C02B